MDTKSAKPIRLYKGRTGISYLGRNVKLAHFFGAKVSQSELKAYCSEVNCFEERDGRSTRCKVHRRMR